MKQGSLLSAAEIYGGSLVNIIALKTSGGRHAFLGVVSTSEESITCLRTSLTHTHTHTEIVQCTNVDTKSST